MDAIETIETDERGLDWIAPLWQQLNEHHRLHSRHFPSWYTRLTFEQRRRTLLAKGTLRVYLARDVETGSWVGYCVSSLSEGKEGEIESLCVDAAYRGRGIGERLVRAALAGLDQAGAVVKRLSVAAGNEEALGFYARLGFYPKYLILEQVQS